MVPNRGMATPIEIGSAYSAAIKESVFLPVGLIICSRLLLLRLCFSYNQGC